VPDTTEVKIDPKTNTLMRKGVPSIANPYDLHALEEALRLKDRYGGKVTAISMGPMQAREVIKKAISLGADDGIILCDVAFAGSDTLATSYILSQAITEIDRKEKVDIVLCGKQAIDGDTAQVGPGIATRLDIPPLTYVLKIDEVDFESKKIKVERMLETGREVVEASLPALLTVVKEANEVRYASLPNLVKSIRHEVAVWNKNSFSIDLSQCGLKGSPTQVKKIFAPPARDIKLEIIPDGEKNPPRAATILAEKLIDIKVVGDGRQ
jgi:electron transfer flavoprotein beta subunit